MANKVKSTFLSTLSEVEEIIKGENPQDALKFLPSLGELYTLANNDRAEYLSLVNDYKADKNTLEKAHAEQGSELAIHKQLNESVENYHADVAKFLAQHVADIKALPDGGGHLSGALDMLVKFWSDKGVEFAAKKADITKTIKKSKGV